MPTKPPEIYALAEKLSKGAAIDAALEVTRRSAHSRAYYSAYHTIVRAAAKARNFPKLDCDHDGLVRYLEDDCEHDDLREVGGNLKTLKEARRDADYKLDVTIQPQATSLLLGLARQIVNASATIHDALKQEKKPPPDRHGRTVP